MRKLCLANWWSGSPRSARLRRCHWVNQGLVTRFKIPGYEEEAFGISPELDIVSDRAEDGGVSLSDKDVYTFPKLIAFKFFKVSFDHRWGVPVVHCHIAPGEVGVPVVLTGEAGEKLAQPEEPKGEAGEKLAQPEEPKECRADDSPEEDLVWVTLASYPAFTDGQKNVWF